MANIRDLMAGDHRHCDACFSAVEQAVSARDWGRADQAFSLFRDAVKRHLEVEESVLFPAFEQTTGMRMGPTRVMMMEHEQMRELLEAAGAALAGRDAEDYSGYAETLLIMTQQHNMKEENVLYPMCDQHVPAVAGDLAARLG